MTDVTVHKKTAYHHGDLKGELIAAARSLIEMHGPDGFSMSDACRLAGVSTAAPYRHFSSKQDLLAAIAADGLKRLGEDMETLVQNHPRGTVESISAIGRGYVDFAIREPHTFRLMFGAMGAKPENAQMREVGRACYGILLGEVAKFLGKTEVDEAVVGRAFPLWTFVHGLSFLAIDGKLDVHEFPVDINESIRIATGRLLS
ncbi:MAG: TetR/AcrR family transcriptional regulator [Roseibium sp.]|nr:TetR/AcrR family transcriptional regulator [Roseibium sp.]